MSALSMFSIGPSLREQMELLVRQVIDCGLSYREAVRSFKKSFIVSVLEENRWNQSKSARQLQMHRNNLAQYMRQLGIAVPRPSERRPPRGQR